MGKKCAAVKVFQTGKDKPHLTAEQKRAARRVKELSRIYYQQYPNGLPQDGVGVNYAKYMCRTMAWLPEDRREQWLDKHAPWMDQDTRDYLLKLGPHWYSLYQLGNHLELYDEDRERLQAWSIEAVDVTAEQRRMINREKNTKSQERRRRKAGAKPHAKSLSRTKPWLALNISRADWYRKGYHKGNPSVEQIRHAPLLSLVRMTNLSQTQRSGLGLTPRRHRRRRASRQPLSLSGKRDWLWSESLPLCRASRRVSLSG